MIYELKGKIPEIHKNSFILPSCHLIGAVKLGEHASIWFGSVLRADNDKIIIGNYSNIQDNCTIHTDYNLPVIIGEKVTVGHNVVLHGCTIADEVIVGMNSTILDGTQIPTKVIIGAGSLVTNKSQIEEGTLVIGSPAKSIRKLNDKEFKLIDDSYKHYIEKIKLYKEELIIKNEK